MGRDPPPIRALHLLWLGIEAGMSKHCLKLTAVRHIDLSQKPQRYRQQDPHVGIDAMTLQPVKWG